MKLTEALRKYAKEHLGVAAEASEDDIKSAIQKALANGALKDAKFAELAEDDSEPQRSVADEIAEKTANAVAGQLGPVLTSLGEGMTAFGEGMDTLTKAIVGDLNADDSGKDADDGKSSKPSGTKSVQEIFESPEAQLFQEELTKRLAARGGDGSAAGIPTSQQVFKMMASAPDDDPVRIRVKDHMEQFSDTKTALTYKKGFLKGQPIRYNGREFNQSTQKTLTMVHAWAKFQTYPEYCTDHDWKIIEHIIHNEKFLSPSDPMQLTCRRLTPMEISHMKAIVPAYSHDKAMNYLNENGSGIFKALIDDSTSGGENSIPEFFDEEIILLPVLGGRVAPLVDMEDVPRGTAAQGFRMANVTFTAANTESTAVSLFSTSSFVANQDTTFFRAAGFIELGRNFLLDAVSSIGAAIQDSYRRKGAEWLDEQLVIGDGTTEPQGIFQASGTTDITMQNPTTGALTITDAINLYFGVSLAFRDNGPKPSLGFVGTDTSYQRFKAIATGVTGDTRLIFGMDLNAYQLFDVVFSVVGTGLANNQIGFAQWFGYKLYRRQGLRLFRETAGDTLTRRHTILLGADMRYGGQLKRGGYAAVADSAPA